MSEKGFLLHVDVSEKKRRLGGSILAQCWDQLGHIVPDIDDAAKLKSAFNVTQRLIESKKKEIRIEAFVVFLT